MNKILKTIYILTLSVFTHSAMSQEKGVWKLLNKAEDFKIQERVMLILDDNLYLSGETINLSATTYDIALQTPVDLSSILYVELYNQENIVCNAQKFLLKQGEAINRLVIPKDLETGYYYIRAYTNYMKNYGPSAFNTQRIKVINPFKRVIATNEKAPKEKLTLDLYAEGGNAIMGIESKIVIKSNVNNTHAILLEDNQPLKETDITDGTGTFIFTPLAGKKYKIEAIANNNEKSTLEIDNIAESGVSCRLESIKPDTAYLRIRTKDFSNYPLTVFVNNQNIVYQYATPLNCSDTTLRLKLPQGMNDIIIKDSGNRETAIRPVFMQSQSNLNISTTIKQTTLSTNDTLTLRISSATRENVKYLVSLNFANNREIPSHRNFIATSLFTSSVYSRSNSIAPVDIANLLTDLSKTNDYVVTLPRCNQPNNSITTYLPEIEQDIISGTVLRKNDREPCAGKSIYLSFVDSVSWVNRCETNVNGRFLCHVPNTYQGYNLVASVLDTSDIYTIKMDDEFYPAFLKVHKEKFIPDSSLKQTIEYRMINLQVNEAFSASSKHEVPARPELRFYGFPDAQYMFRKYVNLPNIEEFVRELVPEIVITKKDSRTELKLRAQLCPGNESPLILLDGVPLLDTEKVNELPCNKLESFRLVSKKFFFGNKIYNGIIDLTSNDKNLDLNELHPNSSYLTFTPVTDKKENQPKDPRIPRYMTNVVFSTLNTSTGVVETKVKMPNNSGTCDLQIFGYSPNGVCEEYMMPKIVVSNKKK
jgi:hypothetical protein